MGEQNRLQAEQSRQQARLAALVETELSRNATIGEAIIQMKQQMGGRLTRSDPHSSTVMPTWRTTVQNCLEAPMSASADDVLPWMQVEVSSWKTADAYHC